MRHRIELAAIIAVTAIASSTNTYAVLSAPYGWYVEGNVGWTKLFDREYPAGAQDTTTGVGGNLNVGYKFMPFFAAEVGYTRYANTKIEDQFGTRAAEDEHYNWSLVAKGIIPFSYTGFEGFGKLGVQRIYSRIKIENTGAANNLGLTSETEGVTGLLLGAGAQYYFSPQIAVVGQWQRAKGNSSTGTLDLYSIGLSFIYA